MEALPTLVLTKPMVYNVIQEFNTLVHAAVTGLLKDQGIIFGVYDDNGKPIFTFNDEESKTKFILKYG